MVPPQSSVPVVLRPGVAPACRGSRQPLVLLLALLLQQCSVHVGDALQRLSPAWCHGP